MDVRRQWMMDRLQHDLIGPMLGEDEVLSDRPSDIYLTGVISTRGAKIDESEQDDSAQEDSGAQGEGSGTGNQISMKNHHMPHSMGFSFRVRDAKKLILQIKGARYSLFDSENPSGDFDWTIPRGRQRWARKGFNFEVSIDIDDVGRTEIDIEHDLALLSWVRPSKEADIRDITLVVSNAREHDTGGENNKILNEII